MYDTLSKAENLGILDELVREGVVPCTLAGQKLHYEVYLKYKNQGVKVGYGKTKAVLLTAIETNQDERTIWAIIKKMEA